MNNEMQGSTEKTALKIEKENTQANQKVRKILE